MRLQILASSNMIGINKCKEIRLEIFIQTLTCETTLLAFKARILELCSVVASDVVPYDPRRTTTAP